MGGGEVRWEGVVNACGGCSSTHVEQHEFKLESLLITSGVTTVSMHAQHRE